MVKIVLFDDYDFNFKDIEEEIFYREYAIDSHLNNYLMNQMKYSSLLLQESASHLLITPGKYVRSKLYSFGCDEIGKEWSEDENLDNAVSLELLHVSTLIHDDIIDNDIKRRGTTTVNVEYGEDVAILSGNVLLAEAISLSSYKDQILSLYKDINDGQCLEIELRDIMLSGNKSNLLDFYENVVVNKTAKFIGCSLSLPSKDVSQEKYLVLKHLGTLLGFLYQVHNDVKDYIESGERDVGSDLKEKKPSILHIFAYEHGIDVFGIYEKEYEKHISSSLRNLYYDMLKKLEDIFKDREILRDSMRHRFEKLYYELDQRAHQKSFEKVFSVLKSSGVFGDVYAFYKDNREIFYDELKHSVRNKKTHDFLVYLESKLYKTMNEVL